MRRLIAPLAAALALSACAHPARQAAVDEGLTWILATEGRDEPALFYGVPDSDHVLLMMECRPRSGAVQVSVFGAPERPARALHLSSGAETLSVAATAEPSLLNDVTVAAAVPADSAVLSRFAETGVLAVGTEPRPRPFPRAPAATGRRFVEACRG